MSVLCMSSMSLMTNCTFSAWSSRNSSPTAAASYGGTSVCIPASSTQARERSLGGFGGSDSGSRHPRTHICVPCTTRGELLERSSVRRRVFQERSQFEREVRMNEGFL